MDLEVQIYYPASGIRNLPSGAVFSLVLCHVEGCPATGDWDQSIPGLPYNPERTVMNDSYVGNDMYVKHVTVPGSDRVVYAAVFACYDPPGNPFGTSSIINSCSPQRLGPIGNDCVHVGMPYHSVAQSPGHALITAFPYFEMAQGSVSTMFESMYSPQLGNARDIQVYVPASLQQNSVSRTVNVLIVNDGSPHYMQQLAFAGGFDRAVLTGAAPETIMIGLPQDGESCQRQLELTFSIGSTFGCNETWSGGNDKYFAFIQNTVVPAVLANLSVTLGEVAMTGASYGGLTSCYAASALPQYFQRAFCQSPSVWWNYAELPDVIKSNAQLRGLPKSVIMYIGTIEMQAPGFTNASQTETVSWFSRVNATAEAWRAGGLDSSNLRLFTLSGGQHDKTAWTSAFSEGIGHMYAPGFASPFQAQYDHNLNVIYPVDAGTTSDPAAAASTSIDDDDDDAASSMDFHVALTVLAVLLTLLVLLNTFQLSHLRRSVRIDPVGHAALLGKASTQPASEAAKV
jgi:enterochelin esterase-like enzyme